MMNITSEAVSTLISSVTFFIAFSLLFYNYMKKRVPAFFWLGITWLTFGIYWFLMGLSYLLYLPTLTEFSLVISSFLAIFVVISYDLVDKERVHAIKTSIGVLLCTTIIYLVLTDDFIEESIIYGNEPTLVITGTLRVVMAVLGIWGASIHTFFSWKLYKEALEGTNTELHYYARMNLIGVVLFGPVSIILFSVGITIVHPLFTILTLSIGSLLSAYAFYRYPNIIFILPFNASRIMVIDGDTGLTIFSYLWKQTDDEPMVNDLYSSLIVSLNDFIQVLLKRGRIGNIEFEGGDIFIEHNEFSNIYFLIQSSNYSKIVSEGLALFSQQFLMEYHSGITEFKKQFMITTNQFEGAEAMVRRIFPMI